LGSSFAFISALLAFPAGAAFPDKPITVVIGFAAGGGSDVLMRSVAPGIGQALGATVIVENRPGAGGNIAMSYVARAPADGYTLLFCSPGIAINPTLYGNLSFVPERDFAPISLVGKVDNVLVVSNSLPVHNLKELIAYGKANPGKLNYASPGVGSSLHLAAELFKTQADLNMVHVPFKGANEALAAVVAGNTDLFFDVVPDAIPLIKAGKVRAIAVTGEQRNESLPEVPTMMEAGLPNYSAITWNGILAPAGTPQAVIDKINAAIRTTVSSPEVLAKFKSLGQQAVSDSPQQFAAFIKDETVKWDAIVRRDNIRMQ
jgi:tripartite-type tricarboxylate transporter receptor subunit TctC